MIFEKIPHHLAKFSRTWREKFGWAGQMPRGDFHAADGVIRGAGGNRRRRERPNRRYAPI